MKKGDNFLLQEEDNTGFVFCGEWKISEENSSGWRSVRCVTTGKYLTTSSKQILSSQGRFLLFFYLLKRSIET